MTESKKVKIEPKIELEKSDPEDSKIQEQIQIKQELIKNEVKTESLPQNSDPIPEITPKEEIHISPKKQVPKVRPQRPQRNAISLAKVAAIDTEGLFVFNNEPSAISPTKTSPSVKEMIKNQPEIETETQRYPTVINAYKSKKRQYIDSLFDKYENGIKIFNEDGSLETPEIEDNKAQISVTPPDQDLELLFSEPKRIRSDKTHEKIDEITRKYSFTENIEDPTVSDVDTSTLNRSLSNEFSVRIKCKRRVYSFIMRQDAEFTEAVGKLAKRLEILPKQIMLIHRDETISHTESPSMLNLDENTILDAIILSSELKSPQKSNEPKIKIKVQFAKNFGGQVPIMAPLTADLSGILVQICESKGLTPSQFQLQFDGEQMVLTNSLKDYDLEDGDVIDAIMVT